MAYANAIAPPGASATMQGIAAGMDDGFGKWSGTIIQCVSGSDNEPHEIENATINTLFLKLTWLFFTVWQT